MEKGESLPKKRPEPIVVEPDDQLVESDRFHVPFEGIFRGDDFFGKFLGDIPDFQKKGYYEVKSYSSYKEYKDGKLVKSDEKGYHYKNDNGKGFMKMINGTPEGKNEEIKKFDFSDRLRIK